MSHQSPLHHQTLLLVDDTKYVLDAFAPALQQLTGQSAAFLLHAQQTAEQLTQEILAHSPQILLLDGNLSQNIKGYGLLPNILKANPDILCIGFSSAESLRSTFLQAGAKGFVYKDPETVDSCLQELEEVVSALIRREA